MGALGTPGEVGGTMGASALGAGTATPAAATFGGNDTFTGYLRGSGRAGWADAIDSAIGKAAPALIGAFTPGAGGVIATAMNRGGAFSGKGAGGGFSPTGEGMDVTRRGAEGDAVDNEEILKWYAERGIPYKRLGGPGAPVVSLDPNISYETHGPGATPNQRSATTQTGTSQNITSTSGLAQGVGMEPNTYMDKALGYLEKQRAQARKDVAPWMQEDFLKEYASAVREGPGEFTESPGYQFTLGEGQKAIERAAAARGGLQSPATQKALAQYATGLASQEYDSFLDRYHRSLAPKADLAGRSLQATLGLQGTQVPVAQTAAGTVGQYGSQAFQAEQAGLDRQLRREVGEDTRQSQYNLMEEQSKSNFWGNILGSAAEAGTLALASKFLG